MSKRFGVIATFEPGTSGVAASPDGVVPILFGTAPVHRLADGVDVPVNVPLAVSSFAEFEKLFGKAEPTEVDAFSLSVTADVLFNRYRAGTCLFVNVFDPAVHQDVGGDPDVTEVTSADVTGSDDAAGTLTGVEVTENAYTETGYVPTVFAAPGFGDAADVSAALRRKAAQHNVDFFGFALIDLDPTADNTADATGAKATAGDGGGILDDGFCAPCWPPVQAQLTRAGVTVTRTEPASLHVLGALFTAAVENGGVPASPSSQSLRALRPAVTLTRADVQTLRNAGIVTFAREGRGGFTVKGNHTSAYLDGQTTADSVEEGLITGDIAARLSANLMANAAVLTASRYLDTPVRRQKIDRTMDAIRLLGNRLTDAGATLGFDIAFRTEDNPPENIAAGVVRFYLLILPPPAMETVELPFTVHLGYFETLTA